MMGALGGSTVAYANTLNNDSASSNSQSSGKTVVSSRKFTVQSSYRGDKYNKVSRSESREDISTTVEADSYWGGLGTMSIGYQQTPQQKSSSEKLGTKVTQGNQLYASSDGKLESADNHLRDDLKTSVDKANDMLSKSETSASDLDSQSDTLDKNMAAINDGIAKKQADDIAASSAASRSSSRSSSTNRSGGSVSSSASAQTQQQITSSYNDWVSTHNDATVGQKVLQYAMQYNGYPYVWGAVGPSSFDCSGLVMYSYAHLGINIPHFSGSQAQQGVEVPANQIQPGDIIANDTHAALYYGKINGVDYVFNALNPRAGVTFTPLQYAFSSSYHIRRVY
jgi:cell wall-associated NlpC family hydrolase